MTNEASLIRSIREAMRRPPNRMRRLLIESHYSLPSSGDIAVMDLYALYTMWWEDGAGKEAYGYSTIPAPNSGRTRTIARKFEDCLSVVANAILEETREALKDEAMQCFDAFLISPDKVIKWAKDNGFLQQLNNLHRGLRFGYGDYATLFSAPFWKEETDWYGGDAWVKIARAVMNLDAQFRRGNNTDIMGAIDALLHIEHNTGSLVSKLKRMKVSKETLDLRAKFTSPAEFKPYVSGPVAVLIR